jgi:hypothetical protein
MNYDTPKIGELWRYSSISNQIFYFLVLSELSFENFVTVFWLEPLEVTRFVWTPGLKNLMEKIA